MIIKCDPLGDKSSCFVIFKKEDPEGEEPQLAHYFF